MALSETPIQAEILGEKHRGDHAQSVVHPARVPKLFHSCIHERIARLTFLPELEFDGAILPGKVFELFFEGAFGGMGKMVEEVVRILLKTRSLLIYPAAKDGQHPLSLLISTVTGMLTLLSEIGMVLVTMLME